MSTTALVAIIVLFSLFILTAIAVPLLGTFAIFAAVKNVLRSHSQREQEYESRQQQGLPGQAVVLHTRDIMGPSEQSMNAIIELTLQITSPNHGQYQATAEWYVNLAQLSKIQPGQTLPVRIDAINPQLIFPDVPWAKYRFPMSFFENLRRGK